MARAKLASDGLKSTIYVDTLMEYGGSAEFRWKKSCHMYTDGDIEDLHKFAEGIGMKRDWFQPDDRLPHYDLNANRRGMALWHGAKSHTLKEMVALMRRREKEQDATISALHRSGTDEQPQGSGSPGQALQTNDGGDS